MKIVFYHHTPLPVKKYGGTERIMFWHMKELVALGHEVVLLGHPDSEVQKFGISLIPLPKDKLRNGWEELIPLDGDILHLQFSTLDKFKIPHICTVHGNAKVNEVLSENSVFVSGKHASIHGSDQFVYNALDFSEYPEPDNLDKKGKEDILFLAKASWKVKNLKDSISICKSLKKHLHIVGGKTFTLSKYIHNHGIIGGEKKLEILRSCDALIFPVKWDEPFGIALVEAMSQGLPVFGSSFGSLPEVIGTAGFTAKSKEELLCAMKNWDIKLTPKEIRNYALEKFNINKYSKSYLELYDKVINKQKLNTKAPLRVSSKDPEELFNF